MSIFTSVIKPGINLTVRKNIAWAQKSGFTQDGRTDF